MRVIDDSISINLFTGQTQIIILIEASTLEELGTKRTNETGAVDFRHCHWNL